MSVPHFRWSIRLREIGRVLALAAIFAVPFGCARDPGAPAIEPETYVDVMVALRLADNQTSSEAEFVERREQILRDAGVTDSVLVQWVRAHGQDLRLMAELWDTINARLNAAEQEGTAR